jgi:hypothetical protein
MTVRTSEEALTTAGATLEKVLDRESELTRLQAEAIAELQTLVHLERRASERARLYRELERLGALGERVEELRLLCGEKTWRLRA